MHFDILINSNTVVVFWIYDTIEQIYTDGGCDKMDKSILKNTILDIYPLYTRK